MLSEKLVKTMIEEKQREAAHCIEGQNALRIAKPRWQTFQNFARNVIEKASLPDEVIYADLSDIIDEDTKRPLYESIAHGNAMVDAEYMAKKLHRRNS